MFKYLSSTPALPLPSCTRTPPLLLCLSSRSLSPVRGCKPKHGLPPRPTCSPDGWVGCRCRLVGGLERRGAIHCWAGQHPLSSGAPSDGGAHWQSRILIWLCKCLLQKAMRCNPYPVVETQSEEGGRKERKQQECREGRVGGWITEKIKYKGKMHSWTKWFCNLLIYTSLVSLSHPLYHQGRSEEKQYTLTHSEWPLTLATGHWIKHSNAYCFSRRSWIQCQKESTMLMRGAKVPRVRFRRPNSRWWHFPRTTQPLIY